jgi:hypothetical protein
MAKGGRFEHGSVLGGKTRSARVSSQWKSTTREISELRSKDAAASQLKVVLKRAPEVGKVVNRRGKKNRRAIHLA